MDITSSILMFDGIGIDRRCSHRRPDNLDPEHVFQNLLKQFWTPVFLKKF